jgi:hypothetical protein
MSDKSRIIIFPSLGMTFNAAAWRVTQAANATNCYAHALNAPQIGYRQLGTLKTGKRKQKPRLRDFIDVRFLHDLALDDGLVEVVGPPFDPERQHIMALFGKLAARNGKKSADFHFMRLNRNHVWSEKKGSDGVFNVDLYLQPLTTERLRDHYESSARLFCAKAQTVFAGYFQVPECGIVIAAPAF